jgi:hypothetical protein
MASPYFAFNWNTGCSSTHLMYIQPAENSNGSTSRTKLSPEYAADHPLYLAGPLLWSSLDGALYLRVPLAFVGFAQLDPTLVHQPSAPYANLPLSSATGCLNGYCGLVFCSQGHSEHFRALFCARRCPRPSSFDPTRLDCPVYVDQLLQ